MFLPHTAGNLSASVTDLHLCVWRLVMWEFPPQLRAYGEFVAVEGETNFWRHFQQSLPLNNIEK